MKKTTLKKTFFFLAAVLCGFLQTGCLSTSYPVFINKKVEVPFSGTMDTRFGYEDLYWGMTFDEASKLEGYPIEKIRKDYGSGPFTIFTELHIKIMTVVLVQNIMVMAM